MKALLALLFVSAPAFADSIADVIQSNQARAGVAFCTAQAAAETDSDKLLQPIDEILRRYGMANSTSALVTLSDSLPPEVSEKWDSIFPGRIRQGSAELVTGDEAKELNKMLRGSNRISKGIVGFRGHPVVATCVSLGKKFSSVAELVRKDMCRSANWKASLITTSIDWSPSPREIACFLKSQI